MFNYGDLAWTTGTLAGGDSSTGLGGTPAGVSVVSRSYWWQFYCYHLRMWRGNSDSMVQPQVAQDSFRNNSNLDLVEPNRIRVSIYACIRSLFADFLMLKMLHTCTYHSAT